MQQGRRSGAAGWSGEAVTRLAIQQRRRLLRTGLALLVQAQDQLHLVGAVTTDDDLRELVATDEVDVAVVEVRVDEWVLDRLVADLRAARPGLLVVGLHAGRSSDHLTFARAAGVEVLLPYAAGCAGLFAAVQGVEVGARREPLVDRRILPSREILTLREQEVLGHISAGLTTQQSAELLEVSPKTVDNHKQRMFAKLGVQNQAHAVAVAHRAGILRPAHRVASDA